MIKKFIFIPIIFLISICGGEDADVTETNESVENIVNSSVEEPTIDLITAVIENDLDLSLIHI